MPLSDLLLAQLTDVFRIGLIIGLIATAFRTRATVALPLSLGLGVIFIALMIPMTLPPTGQAAQEPLWRLAVVGALANLIMVAIGMAIWTVVQRTRR
jgi:hypothetical protein